MIAVCDIFSLVMHKQSGEHYYLNSLTIRDRLSQNTVYDILQDKAGFMVVLEPKDGSKPL